MSAVGGKADRTSEINNLANEIPLGVISGVTLRNGPVARTLAAVSPGALAGCQGGTQEADRMPRDGAIIFGYLIGKLDPKRKAPNLTVQRGLL